MSAGLLHTRGGFGEELVLKFVNPETDEYPYPVDAIDMTYDGLHPSDKGYRIIADMLIKVMKKY